VSGRRTLSGVYFFFTAQRTTKPIAEIHFITFRAISTEMSPKLQFAFDVKSLRSALCNIGITATILLIIIHFM
jgi:hypothetical protein